MKVVFGKLIHKQYAHSTTYKTTKYVSNILFCCADSEKAWRVRLIHPNMTVDGIVLSNAHSSYEWAPSGGTFDIKSCPFCGTKIVIETEKEKQTVEHDSFSLVPEEYTVKANTFEEKRGVMFEVSVIAPSHSSGGPIDD